MSSASIFVFDIDDTLYPEIQFVKSGFKEVASCLTTDPAERKLLEFQLWQIFKEEGSGRVFNRLLEEQGDDADPETILELIDVYREHTPDIKPFEGLVSCLDALKKQGHSLSLLSDGFQSIQRRKLRILEIQDFFDFACFTPDLGLHHRKPDPAGYLQVQASLTRPARCVYIADNVEKDFVTPNRLGWRTIRMELPDQLYTNIKAPTPKHEAQHTVKSYSSLAELLLK